MKSIRSGLMVSLCVVGAASAAVVMEDDFTVKNPQAAHVEPNTGMPERQKGQCNTKYLLANANDTLVEGSFGAVEVQSTAFEPKSDVLFIRAATAPSGLSTFSVDLEHNFGGYLSKRKWIASYTVRCLSMMTGSQDNWLGFAYGAGEQRVDAGGMGSDVFTFGIRENGECLLWYRDAHNNQQFKAAGLTGFVKDDQVKVQILMDEKPSTPKLSVILTPSSTGKPVSLFKEVEVAISGSNGWFEFRAANISGGTPGQVFDARIDDLKVEVAK